MAAAAPETAMRPIPLMTALVLATASLSATAGTVFKDDFSSKRSGWADNSEATMLGKTRGMGIYDDLGKFQMTPLENDTIGLIPSPKQAADGNVRITTDMFVYVSEGRGAGGVFCRTQDRDNFYAFLVTGNGGWSIIRSKDGKGNVLASGALPRQVVDGMVDGVVGAECKGNTFTMTFKGKRLGSGTDDTWSNGQAGLVVLGTNLAATSALYDDFLLESL